MLAVVAQVLALVLSIFAVATGTHRAYSWYVARRTGRSRLSEPALRQYAEVALASLGKLRIFDFRRDIEIERVYVKEVVRPPEAIASLGIRVWSAPLSEDS